MADILDNLGSLALTLDERFEHARSALGCTAEQEADLRNLLSEKAAPVFYVAFEPSLHLSGRTHIAQGVLKAIIVNKLTKCGFKVVVWMADWLSKLSCCNDNKKGDLHQKIQSAGRHMIEVWKVCGMETTNVEFVWSSEEINKVGSLLPRHHLALCFALEVLIRRRDRMTTGCES